MPGRCREKNMSETTQEAVEPSILTCGGFTGKWSNQQAPKIGDRVKVTMNGLGVGTITGFFVESGWLGVIVQPDEGQRPKWHVDQFKRNKYEFIGYQVFGAEIKFMDEPLMVGAVAIANSLAPVVVTFKQLPIGEEFDFISGTHNDTFFERCKKVSARKYSYPRQGKDAVATIGSVYARVYHVGKAVVQ